VLRERLNACVTHPRMGWDQAAREFGMTGVESHLPGRTIVPPVQLSLLPDQVPTPLPDLIGQFPENDVAAVVALLAALIARGASRGGGKGGGR